MPRPYIEFIHSQNLPWKRAGFRSGGVRWKVLSADDETGACTVLIDYPAGWRAAQPFHSLADEEFFVLSGALAVNETAYSRHNYAFLPRGFPRRRMATEHGAQVIVFFSLLPSDMPGEAEPGLYDAARLIERIDTIALAWDQSNIDPNINHLHAARKNLRLSPDGDCRTYLLGGRPHGFPPSGDESLERHPHAEEMFMIAGDMPCSMGVMQTGAYFYRPPNIWHGADCTLAGYLMLMRTPGSNKTISEWSREKHPVTFTPAHAVNVPENLREAAAPPVDQLVY
jgi:quercetin dioxygenase-like cupin family protein